VYVVPFAQEWGDYDACISDGFGHVESCVLSDNMSDNPVGGAALHIPRHSVTIEQLLYTTFLSVFFIHT
jgi:hypothetical protein